jgi:hypothetical protein
MKNEQVALLLCPIPWRNMSFVQITQNFVVLSLEPGQCRTGFNTVVLTIGSVSTPYQLLSATNTVLAEGELPMNRMLSDVGLTEEFRLLLGGNDIDLVPLFLIIRDDNRDRVITYSATILHEGKILFLNSNPDEEIGNFRGSQSIMECLHLALINHRKNKLPLNNHNNQNPFLKKSNPDEEIEYKLNLYPGTDIWSIAQKFYELFRKGALQGFVLHFDRQLMLWEFENHLFEIVAPPSERGYISFIPCPLDMYIVKQKTYSEDALQRIERSKRGVKLTGSFEDYLAVHYPGLTFKKHPPFTRIRYDLDIESLESGNHYSVMIDKSLLRGTTTYPPLVQVEIEYIETRTVGKVHDLMSELDSIYQFVKETLSEEGIEFKETFYSKLTYLKDYNQTSGRATLT